MGSWAKWALGDPSALGTHGPLVDPWARGHPSALGDPWAFGDPWAIGDSLFNNLGAPGGIFDAKSSIGTSL